MDVFNSDIRSVHLNKGPEDKRVEVGDGDSELGGNWDRRATAIGVSHLANVDIVEVCLSKKEIDDEVCSRSEECWLRSCRFNRRGKES